MRQTHGKNEDRTRQKIAGKEKPEPEAGGEESPPPPARGRKKNREKLFGTSRVRKRWKIERKIKGAQKYVTHTSALIYSLVGVLVRV